MMTTARWLCLLSLLAFPFLYEVAGDASVCGPAVAEGVIAQDPASCSCREDGAPLGMLPCGGTWKTCNSLDDYCGYGATHCVISATYPDQSVVADSVALCFCSLSFADLPGPYQYNVSSPALTFSSRDMCVRRLPVSAPPEIRNANSSECGDTFLSGLTVHGTVVLPSCTCDSSTTSTLSPPCFANTTTVSPCVNFYSDNDCGESCSEVCEVFTANSSVNYGKCDRKRESCGVPRSCTRSEAIAHCGEGFLIGRDGNCTVKDAAVVCSCARNRSEDANVLDKRPCVTAVTDLVPCESQEIASAVCGENRQASRCLYDNTTMLARQYSCYPILSYRRACRSAQEATERCGSVNASCVLDCAMTADLPADALADYIEDYGDSAEREACVRVQPCTYERDCTEAEAISYCQTDKRLVPKRCRVVQRQHQHQKRHTIVELVAGSCEYSISSASPSLSEIVSPSMYLPYARSASITWRRCTTEEFNQYCSVPTINPSQRDDCKIETISSHAIHVDCGCSWPYMSLTTLRDSMNQELQRSSRNWINRCSVYTRPCNESETIAWTGDMGRSCTLACAYPMANNRQESGPPSFDAAPVLGVGDVSSMTSVCQLLSFSCFPGSAVAYQKDKVSLSTLSREVGTVKPCSGDRSVERIYATDEQRGAAVLSHCGRYADNAQFHVINGRLRPAMEFIQGTCVCRFRQHSSLQPPVIAMNSYELPCAQATYTRECTYAERMAIPRIIYQNCQQRSYQCEAMCQQQRNETDANEHCFSFADHACFHQQYEESCDETTTVTKCGENAQCWQNCTYVPVGLNISRICSNSVIKCKCDSNTIYQHTADRGCGIAVSSVSVSSKTLLRADHSWHAGMRLMETLVDPINRTITYFDRCDSRTDQCGPLTSHVKRVCPLNGSYSACTSECVCYPGAVNGVNLVPPNVNASASLTRPCVAFLRPAYISEVTQLCYTALNCHVSYWSKAGVVTQNASSLPCRVPLPSEYAFVNATMICNAEPLNPVCSLLAGSCTEPAIVQRACTSKERDELCGFAPLVQSCSVQLTTNSRTLSELASVSPFRWTLSQCTCRAPFQYSVVDQRCMDLRTVITRACSPEVKTRTCRDRATKACYQRRIYSSNPPVVVYTSDGIMSSITSRYGEVFAANTPISDLWVSGYGYQVTGLTPLRLPPLATDTVQWETVCSCLQSPYQNAKEDTSADLSSTNTALANGGSYPTPGHLLSCDLPWQNEYKNWGMCPSNWRGFCNGVGRCANSRSVPNFQHRKAYIDATLKRHTPQYVIKTPVATNPGNKTYQCPRNIKQCTDITGETLGGVLPRCTRPNTIDYPTAMSIYLPGTDINNPANVYYTDQTDVMHQESVQEKLRGTAAAAYPLPAWFGRWFSDKVWSHWEQDLAWFAGIPIRVITETAQRGVLFHPHNMCKWGMTRKMLYRAHEWEGNAPRCHQGRRYGFTGEPNIAGDDRDRFCAALPPTPDCRRVNPYHENLVGQFGMIPLALASENNDRITRTDAGGRGDLDYINEGGHTRWIKFPGGWPGYMAGGVDGNGCEGEQQRLNTYIGRRAAINQSDLPARLVSNARSPDFGSVMQHCLENDIWLSLEYCNPVTSPSTANEQWFVDNPLVVNQRLSPETLRCREDNWPGIYLTQPSFTVCRDSHIQTLYNESMGIYTEEEVSATVTAGTATRSMKNMPRAYYNSARIQDHFYPDPHEYVINPSEGSRWNAYEPTNRDGLRGSASNHVYQGRSKTFRGGAGVCDTVDTHQISPNYFYEAKWCRNALWSSGPTFTARVSGSLGTARVAHDSWEPDNNAGFCTSYNEGWKPAFIDYLDYSPTVCAQKNNERVWGKIGRAIPWRKYPMEDWVVRNSVYSYSPTLSTCLDVAPNTTAAMVYMERCSQCSAPYTTAATGPEATRGLCTMLDCDQPGTFSRVMCLIVKQLFPDGVVSSSFTGRDAGVCGVRGTLDLTTMTCTCDIGYRVNTNSSSVDFDRCTAELCTPSCGSNGICMRNTDFTNETYRCICASGYTGASCNQLAVDLCRNGSNICSLRGECNSEGKCECFSSWAGSYTGTYCQNFASNITCLNNGTLTEIVVGGRREMACSCPDAFTGSRCEFSRCPVVNGSVCNGQGKCMMTTIGSLTRWSCRAKHTSVCPANTCCDDRPKCISPSYTDTINLNTFDESFERVPKLYDGCACEHRLADFCTTNSSAALCSGLRPATTPRGCNIDVCNEAFDDPSLPSTALKCQCPVGFAGSECEVNLCTAPGSSQQCNGAGSCEAIVINGTRTAGCRCFTVASDLSTNRLFGGKYCNIDITTQCGTLVNNRMAVCNNAGDCVGGNETHPNLFGCQCRVSSTLNSIKCLGSACGGTCRNGACVVDVAAGTESCVCPAGLLALNTTTRDCTIDLCSRNGTRPAQVDVENRRCVCTNRLLSIESNCTQPICPVDPISKDRCGRTINAERFLALETAELQDQLLSQWNITTTNTRYKKCSLDSGCNCTYGYAYNVTSRMCVPLCHPDNTDTIRVRENPRTYADIDCLCVTGFDPSTNCYEPLCRNGGVLVTISNFWMQCQCPPLWTGIWCTTPRCQNGGVAATVNATTCTCPSPYLIGQYCEQRVCANNQTFDATTQRCNCNYPFNGTYCEGNVCGPRGRVNSAGTGCECEAGYNTDLYCSGPCSDERIYTRSLNGSCVCRETGALFPSCQYYPCGYNGVMVNSRCVCITDFWTNNPNDNDRCTKNLCGPNGYPSTSRPKTCVCAPGYSAATTADYGTIGMCVVNCAGDLQRDAATGQRCVCKSNQYGIYCNLTVPQYGIDIPIPVIGATVNSTNSSVIVVVPSPAPVPSPSPTPPTPFPSQPPYLPNGTVSTSNNSTPYPTPAPQPLPTPAPTSPLTASPTPSPTSIPTPSPTPVSSIDATESSSSSSGPSTALIIGIVMICVSVVAIGVAGGFVFLRRRVLFGSYTQVTTTESPP